jgi:hypothetical protein
METIVAGLQRPTGETRKPRAAAINTEWPTVKLVREPDAANRHIRLDFITSITIAFPESSRNLEGR